MNVRTILLWGILVFLLLQSGCQSPTGPEQAVTSIPTTVSGMVMRNDNLAPIANAIVYDIGGLARDTSKSDGTFKMVYQLLAQTKTTIVGTRAGFGNDTAFVTLNPGIDTTIVLRLKADSTSPSGAISTGKAANIVLITSSSENISIRGTGYNETALLTFEVRDSLGIPVGGSNKLTVNFTIRGGPQGGEYVFPASAQTDPLTGRVTTRVSSGTKAGVLQVFATATVPVTPPVTITSSPVKITISGGLPVADRFSLSRKSANIAGGVYDNLRDQIMAIVGDKEGNPVQQGTAVSFTTTGGIIQPNALTDKDGIAVVDLISGNPRPPSSVVTVTAKTIGDSGLVIQKPISVLFSGPTRILVPTSTITIPDSGTASFQYRVQDPNGFPLVAGTSISVTVEGPGAGQLQLFGDVSKSLEDTDDPNSTLFKVTVQDKIRKGPAGSITFKVAVTSQNGNGSATFNGLVLEDTTAVPPVTIPLTSGYASSLTLTSITTPQVSVRGTGANETSRLVFTARDSVGNSIELRRRAYVTFSISPTGGLNGGEFLFPSGDSTDASGQVGTTFNAGTRSGVIQVIARTDVGGRTITSMPVRLTISGGLPDSNSFTASLSRVNMPGLVKTGTLGTVSVQVGDKFGNAVQPGIALYFSTTGGLIQATATTGDAGQASVSLQGGNPIPNEPSLGGAGHGHVTIQTVGENGVAIRKSVPFLFSGAPLVNAVNVPGDSLSIAAGSFADIVYRVEDLNGNPVSSGHTVTVTATGAASGLVDVSGDVTVTTPDTRDKSAAQYKFCVSDKSATGGVGGSIVFTINVTGESGSFVKRIYAVLSPGVVVPPAPRSGYASSLTLASVTTTQLSVRGTWPNEIATLVFVAKDSVGNLVDIQRKALVNFSITPVGGLGGGEFVSPASSYTDSLGQVSTTFNAGTKAGVVQVVATANVSGKTISSSPVRLTVFGGLPDSPHFTATISPQIIPAWPAGPNQKVATALVQVGDKYGNPVPPGTALYFTTTKGVIVASASTDAVGMAGVDLYGGNPVATDSAVITVRTVGEGGLSIFRYLSVLIAAAPTVQVLTVPNDTVVVAAGGYADVVYRAQDANGNPLPVGSTITVSATGSASGLVDLTGDLSVATVDTRDRNTTRYQFRVSDKSATGGAGGNIVFTISVSGPSGSYVKRFYGVLRPGVVVPPPPRSGYASSLTLVSVSTATLSVRGTGPNETSSLVFIAKDSAGTPVDIQRKATVSFSIMPLGGLGGGEFIAPAVGTTDSSGQVAATFNAGIRSGVVQIVATANANGRTITSSPVRLTIYGGLPDAAHFTALITPSNMPGWNPNPVQVGTVSVQVGDKFGNPVQAGTALYFSTTGGLVQASATTDDVGHASVALFGGRPFPNDNGAGYGHVTVQTVGEGGVSVSQSIPFLFSGPAAVALLNVPNDTIKVFDGGSFDVDYMVSDVNGNPISGGNAIAVSVSGLAANGVRLTGDIAVVTTDTQDKTTQRYRFRVSDVTANGGPSGDLAFTITVNGVVARRFYGVLYPAQVSTVVSVTARQPAQIAFLGITVPDIYVAGVGNTENTVITYEVRDSLGVPITKQTRAFATFDLQFYPNNYTGGGTPPTVIPGADSTDDTGKLRASIVSGYQAGVIQLVARIALPNGPTVVSQPVKITVHAGFADQAHFTLMPGRWVFPGFDSFNIITFTAAVGDTFSNPVQAGTAIYFNSTAGIMETGTTSGGLASYTDATGLARAALYTVNPKPNALPYEYIPAPSDPYYADLGGPIPRHGYHWVYAQTQGRAGKKIIDSVLVEWNRAPIVVTGVPTSIIAIPQGSTSAPITITVKDANGNPLCDGTTIGVSLSYTTDVVGIAFGASGQLSSSSGFMMPNAGFARFPASGVTDFTFFVSDLSTGGGATLGQSVLVTVIISSPGLATAVVSFGCVVQ